jgi:uracil-DNA glycosylase
MLRAGFASAEEFRRLTYIAALMRCFPGRNATGKGDLRPSPASTANCAHWLEAELSILKPKVLIPVGQMAINRFLGAGSLEGRVGKRFGQRPVIVPLPHPSGTSRWLNDQANRERLASALELIADLRLRHASLPKKISALPRATGSLTGHPARLSQRLIDKEKEA